MSDIRRNAFRLDNTEGWTQAECDGLNRELTTRLSGLDKDSDDFRDVIKRFADEVVQR